MEFFHKYYPYIISILQGAVILVVLALKGKFITRKDCATCQKACSETKKEQSDAVDDLEDRVTRNEERLANQPTSEDVSALTLALERLSGDLGILAERIEGVKEAQVSTKELAIRLDNYLRKKG